MRRRASGTLPARPPADYEPYLDGLFTYCLSILCEHDAAAAALGDALALAERQRPRLRDAELRRAWLYALARWACVRRLEEGRPQDDRPEQGSRQQPLRASAERRGELASLAWPEAAGTTPAQREALELAVRHQLRPHEVGAVLGMETEAARALLARAACEVERTRAALAVVELGRCTAVARLAAGDPHLPLGPELRKQIVRHVDECPQCRITAERAVATAPWPGLATTAATAVLAVVPAPRPAVYAALLHTMPPGAGRTRAATPRFDRRGFPLDVTEHAVRRARLRHRAVTTTVVVAVVAAPVLAIWTAYQTTLAAPHGTKGDGSFSAGPQAGVLSGDTYERTGTAGAVSDPTPPSRQGGRPSVSASVASGAPGAASPTPGGSARPGPGALSVRAGTRGGDTLITLTAAADGSPVSWTASTGAGWLRLSASSGTLRPGGTATITVSVDPSAEPVGPWTARIAFQPSGAVVTLHGSGRPQSPAPVPTPSPTPSPAPPSSSPDPSPSG
ncbi:BACON domain-containing protein [Actinacidiphila oryziradicis]|uniref:BACON domain-containing protein n=1 Tax=Actinacidiphila oryziradicis TaxID=2571141 RepID=UPI002247A614|nr:sigma-70 family RNA polymerase sigma factor [Actinacidiphila oryziradicis]